MQRVLKPDLGPYADDVVPHKKLVDLQQQPMAKSVRDPLSVPELVLDARRHSMSERLELALSWNSVAAELRAGLTAELERSKPGA